MIVVTLNVELANGACAASAEQPLVNAIRVEVVETGHRSNALPVFVLHDADHAFLVSFVFLFLQELPSYLSLWQPKLLFDVYLRLDYCFGNHLTWFA